MWRTLLFHTYEFQNPNVSYHSSCSTITNLRIFSFPNIWPNRIFIAPWFLTTNKINPLRSDQQIYSLLSFLVINILFSLLNKNYPTNPPNALFFLNELLLLTKFSKLPVEKVFRVDFSSSQGTTHPAPHIQPLSSSMCSIG